MNQIEQLRLQKRIQDIESALARLEQPERGYTLYNTGVAVLTVRYSYTAGTVPYRYNFWNVSNIFVPSGGLLKVTMDWDSRVSGGASQAYLEMINNNPPTGAPQSQDNKFPSQGQNHRHPVTTQLIWDYAGEADTTVSFSMYHDARITGFTYYVFETWTRLYWQVWL